MKIKELKIFTPNLAEQVNFYSSVLGFELIRYNKQDAIFRIGSSILIFEYREKFKPYHFAFDIPSNKVAEALSWLKKSVPILLHDEKEIQYFDFWNAEAIYFYDSDKNIVEFIARKNLNNFSEIKFDGSSLINISEIGLATNEIEYVFDILNKKCNLNIFSGGVERFCAIGDEEGLIICINKNLKDWFPVNDKAFSADFEIEIKNNNKKYRIAYKNNEINIFPEISQKHSN